jgi:thermostable 8-oxoguanine DNA glycosylase
MVDPTDFSNVNADDWSLQSTLIFWMCVAGKNATQTVVKVEAFLTNLHTRFGPNKTPFELINTAIARGHLEASLRHVKLGKYTLLTRGLTQVITLDPRSCTVEELESIPGIGPKTARCFLLHSRENQQLAGLDTHILRWLREWGYKDIPRSTPPAGATYRRIEQYFLREAHIRHMKPADLDLQVWMHYAGRKSAPHLMPVSETADAA